MLETTDWEKLNTLHRELSAHEDELNDLEEEWLVSQEEMD